MKKFAVIFTMILVLAFIMTGCGQPATSTPTQATQPDQPTQAVQEPTKASTAPVELVYMRQAEGIDLELQIVDEFNKTHPNIHVTVDSTPAGQHYQKLALTTEAGNPPDIFMTYFTIGAATNGLALDLTPYIQKEGDAFFNSYVKAGWLFNEYAGKYYGAPYRVAPVSVILNKKMFANAGVPLPPNDWTWDDFIATAQKLTNPEKGEYGYCLTGSAESFGTDAQFYPFLYANKGVMINSEGLAGFNTPEGTEALQFMVDLVNKYKVVPPGITSTSNNNCTDLLASDKVAMWIDGSLWLGFIRAARPEVDITLAPLPYNKAKITSDGGTGFGISSKTKHPDEAWEFLKYMMSDAVMKKWALAASFTPANVNVLKDPEFLANEEQAKIAWILANYKIYPLSHYPDNANLESKLRTYIQAAYLGTSTPKEALDGAAAEWNVILKTYQSDNWWAFWKTLE